jgi:choline dehydrogenase-like flavoprotein
VDWPISYNELEPYYEQAELTMAISGPDDGSPYPRRMPYPQPPHRFTDPEKLLKAAYPNLFFHVPTARARIATANRPHCCATGVCKICPIDAKFTILNEMQDTYADERITLEVKAVVQDVDVTGGVAKAVNYTQDGVLKRAEADLVVLGANALFNPHILLRSGFNHPILGKGLNDQVSVAVSVDLKGLDNYQGSTSITGFGYMEYDGPHRSERAGCLIETNNMVHLVNSLRLERGKWRRRLNIAFIFEDLPSEDNYVKVSERRPDLPEAVYVGHSAYTQRAIDALPQIVPKFLEPLPIDEFTISPTHSHTEQHILGTTVMGNDPARSIVDRHLVHHQVRNLLVLGSGAFPTGSPSHPTLTLSALSLWAADHLI